MTNHVLASLDTDGLIRDTVHRPIQSRGSARCHTALHPATKGTTSQGAVRPILPEVFNLCCSAVTLFSDVRDSVVDHGRKIPNRDRCQSRAEYIRFHPYRTLVSPLPSYNPQKPSPCVTLSGHSVQRRSRQCGRPWTKNPRS